MKIQKENYGYSLILFGISLLLLVGVSIDNELNTKIDRIDSLMTNNSINKVDTVCTKKEIKINRTSTNKEKDIFIRKLLKKKPIKAYYNYNFIYGNFIDLDYANYRVTIHHKLGKKFEASGGFKVLIIDIDGYIVFSGWNCFSSDTQKLIEKIYNKSKKLCEK